MSSRIGGQRETSKLELSHRSYLRPCSLTGLKTPKKSSSLIPGRLRRMKTGLDLGLELRESQPFTIVPDDSRPSQLVIVWRSDLVAELVSAAETLICGGLSRAPVTRRLRIKSVLEVSGP